jgi:hypothetical protein
MPANKGDRQLTHDSTFTLEDVLSRGFEARCVGPDGSRYLWHGDSGLRVEVRTGRTTLLTDPAILPEGEWIPTTLGLEELGEAVEPA